MISNVQQRVVPAPFAVVAPILDRIAEPDGGVWPSPPWMSLRLDRGLAVGSRGGHGTIRYEVAGHDPGRWARFAFDPGVGLQGYHEFVVREVPGGTEITHHLVGTSRPAGRMRWLWPLAVRWLHEALLQDLLDNWERAATGTVRRPARWSPWVRILHRTLLRRARTGGQRTASSQIAA